MLKHEAHSIPGPTPCAPYKILHAPLPFNTPSALPPDSPLHWTIYRQSSSPSSPKPFWKPLLTFPLISTPAMDNAVRNHYISSHPASSFRALFLATRLREDGSRATFTFSGKTRQERVGERRGKLQRTKVEGEKVEEWVEMKIGPVREVLEREFGFAF